jgi:integral membrane sensor domain MASE1
MVPTPLARHWIVRCLATAVLYAITCELALLAAYSSIALCAFWPAAAVALVCIWRWRWAGVAGVMSGSLALSAITVDAHAGAAIAIAAGRTAAGMAGAWFLRWAGFDPDFTRVRDALLLLVASASSVVAGLIGASSILYLDPGSPWLLVLRTWTSGDALGILACAPAFFTLGPVRELRTRIAEITALVAATTVCAVLVYLVLEPRLGVTGPALFLVFPPLLWAALRFGARGAAWAMLLVALVAFAGAATGTGVFVPGAERDGRLASFQAFLAALSVTFLVVGAAMDELRASHLRALGAGRMEAVGRMAGGIAHDFNNLLAVIIGCAETIRRRQPPGADPRPVDRLMSAAQRGPSSPGSCSRSAADSRCPCAMSTWPDWSGPRRS